MGGRERPLVGLVVPSSNPTIERFLQTGVPSRVLGADFLCSRLRVTRIAVDGEADAQFAGERMAQAADLLADADVDVLMWAGTSGFWLGGATEAGLQREIADRTGIRSATGRQALLAAARRLAPASVAVLTPYTPDVHARVLQVWRDEGFRTVADRALGLARNRDFADVPAEVVDAEVRGLAPAVPGGAVAVVCTNMLALVADAGPVLDSTVAALWWSALLAGATDADYASCYERMRAAVPVPAAVPR